MWSKFQGNDVAAPQSAATRMQKSRILMVSSKLLKMDLFSGASSTRPPDARKAKLATLFSTCLLAEILRALGVQQ